MTRAMDKMCELIDKEIEKIADKGLSTSNLETAYKLIDMYKDLKTVEGMEDYTDDYSGNDMMSGKHYVRGHYSRTGEMDNSMRRMYSRDGMDNSMRNDAYSRYSQAKRNYRYSKTDGNKQMIMDSLDDYMADMTEKLEDMLSDADTQEEQQMIQKYINKLRQLKA